MIQLLEQAADDAAGDDADALEALATGTRIVLERGALGAALAAIVRAAAKATRAEAVLARVANPETGDFVIEAVHTRTAALAAELEGSTLAEADVPQTEAEYTPRANGDAPAAVRRAATRSGADFVRLIPVATEQGIAATLELYTRGSALSPRADALARLAAAHIGLALELTRALALSDAASERARGSLELIGDALAAGSDEAEAAEQVVRLACEATGASRSLLWRIETEGRPSFLAGHGFEGDPPGLEAAADAVRAAVERRDDDGEPAQAGSPDGAGTERIVALGEPPAGALQLVFDGPVPPEADGEHLAAFSARVAVALRRTRRAQLVTLALRRSQTIVAVISQAIARLSLSHTLETAVERISDLTASSHVAIYLREGERLSVAASRGLEYPHSGLAERLLELALGPFRGRGFLFIDDMRRDPRLAGLEDVLTATGVRRALVVPLVVRDEVIGALAVYKSRPRPYRAGEEGLLIALSSQLAVAVQNARLHEQTKELGEVLERTLLSERKAARQLRGLFQISHSFTRSLSLEATLEAVAKTMVELLGVDAAAIRMPDERRQMLVQRAMYVADPGLREAARRMFARPEPMGSPFLRGLLESGRPLVLSARDARGAGDSDDLLAPFLLKGSTVAVLPMATPGEVLGTLTLLSLDPTKPLDDETVETAMTVTAQAALAIDNARMYQQQRDFAETMQRSLLPREIPSIRGLEVGHVYQSSSRVDVGGDVYDFLSLEDGRLAVILGDVTGKGIQAAADMAMAKFSFRALARSYPDPAEFLAKANEVVIEEIAVGKFITMVYALIDPSTHDVAYASAGHPPARFVSADGTVSTLATTGLALGIEPEQEYSAARTTLAPGAAVVLFTDGVTEARRDGELYGEARLDTFLSEHAGLPAQALVEAVLADCRAFAEGEVDDDCAVVCLRLAP